MATGGNGRAPRVTMFRVLVRGARRWAVSWRVDGRRKRRFFASKAAAEEEVATLRAGARDDAGAWLALTPEERADVLAVVRAAREHGTTVGRVWADWLAGGRRNAAVTRATLGAAIDQFLAFKRTGGRSDRYLDCLESIFRGFAQGREGMPLTAVSSSMVLEWMGSLPAASRRTYMVRLSTLYRWAIRQGLATEDPTAAIEHPMEPRRTPTALSPSQAATCYTWAMCNTPEALGALALSLGAGLRPEEAQRTAWSAIDLEAGLVRVEAQTSKVRKRRVVYPMPAALAWLRESKRVGAVLPLSAGYWRKMTRGLRRQLGLARWPQDVTRHTAASYWLAATEDAARVAEALGNSPGILKTHYRALVTREDAARFWSIVPR